MAQIDLKKVIVLIKDGAGHSLQIKVAEGQLDYTEHKDRKYTLDRGKLGTVMNADEKPVDVKFSLIWENVTWAGSGVVTPSDALKQEGGASAWTSSDTDLCEPYSVDIELTYDPACSPTLTEVITLPLFRYEDVNMVFKDGTIQVTGKCNVVEATAVRA